MRGENSTQGHMFTYLSPEQRVPADHPLREIKENADLLKHDVATKFFDAVVRMARQEHLLSDEHFTVDGTLVEAWASMKSFRPKGEPPTDRPTTDGDPGNPSVDFRGEKRTIRYAQRRMNQ